MTLKSPIGLLFATSNQHSLWDALVTIFLPQEFMITCILWLASICLGIPMLSSHPYSPSSISAKPEFPSLLSNGVTASQYLLRPSTIAKNDPLKGDFISTVYVKNNVIMNTFDFSNGVDGVETLEAETIDGKKTVTKSDLEVNKITKYDMEENLWSAHIFPIAQWKFLINLMSKYFAEAEVNLDTNPPLKIRPAPHSLKLIAPLEASRNLQIPENPFDKGLQSSLVQHNIFGNLQRNLHMPKTPFDKGLESNLVQHNIFGYLQPSEKLALAQTSKQSYADFINYISSKPYINQFDNMVMLAANACMRGLNLLEGMTINSCLKEIVDPPKSAHIVHILTARQLEILILNAINQPSVQSFNILVYSRFFIKIFRDGPLPATADDKMISIMHTWASAQQFEGRLYGDQVRARFDDAKTDILKTILILKDIYGIPTGNDLSYNQVENMYLLVHEIWKYVISNEISKVKEILLRSPFLFFGEGSVISPIARYTFKVDSGSMWHANIILSTEMRNLLLNYGAIPTYSMITGAGLAGDIESFEKFMKYGFVQQLRHPSPYNLLTGLAYKGNTRILTMILDDPEQESLPVNLIAGIVAQASQGGNVDILRLLLRKGYHFDVEQAIDQVKKCKEDTVNQLNDHDRQKYHKCDLILQFLNGLLL